jgi:F0F1-type ATP synthase delta subunit
LRRKRSLINVSSCMNVRDYSTAVLELLIDGKDERAILERLQRVLEDHGHERLYPKILADLAQRLEKREDKRGVVITLARASDESVFKEEITKALTALQATEYTTKMDPSITGGFIAQGGEKRIDASYKKTLLTLYRSLITKV